MLNIETIKVDLETKQQLLEQYRSIVKVEKQSRQDIEDQFNKFFKGSKHFFAPLEMKNRDQVAEDRF
jgi:hypothetical protein